MHLLIDYHRINMTDFFEIGVLLNKMDGWVGVEVELCVLLHPHL